MIPGNTSSQGKKPTTPTIGTATAGSSAATVAFTESTYRGKTNSGTYKAIAFIGGVQTDPLRSGTCNAPCSSIAVSSLTNGTAYTFKVELETPYGVISDVSASSNSVTPSAPPPDFPPTFGPTFGPTFPNCCPSGGSYNSGDNNCYYNCGTGSSVCTCGPGQATGYTGPNGTADCYYTSPNC